MGKETGKRNWKRRVISTAVANCVTQSYYCTTQPERADLAIQLAVQQQYKTWKWRSAAGCWWVKKTPPFSSACKQAGPGCRNFLDPSLVRACLTMMQSSMVIRRVLLVLAGAALLLLPRGDCARPSPPPASTSKYVGPPSFPSKFQVGHSHTKVR